MCTSFIYIHLINHGHFAENILISIKMPELPSSKICLNFNFNWIICWHLPLLDLLGMAFLHCLPGSILFKPHSSSLLSLLYIFQLFFCHIYMLGLHRKLFNTFFYSHHMHFLKPPIQCLSVLILNFLACSCKLFRSIHFIDGHSSVVRYFHVAWALQRRTWCSEMLNNLLQGKQLVSYEAGIFHLSTGAPESFMSLYIMLSALCIQEAVAHLSIVVLWAYKLTYTDPSF